MLLHDFLDYWARQRPDGEFAVDDRLGMSYRQAQRATIRLAHAFVRAGLEPGDRLAIVAKNRIDFALVYLAASRVGVVPVPLNYRSAPTEWAYVLNDSEARMVLAAAPYTSALDAIRSDVPGIIHYVALDAGDAHWIDYQQWVNAQPSDESLEVQIDGDSDLIQLYTSGTTGHAKGAVLTQRAVVANIVQIGAGAHRGSAGERSLVVSPMLHAAVIWSAFAPLGWGGALYIVEDFDPARVVDILDTENIGYAALVPTMLQACMRVPGAAYRAYATLRLIHTGAAAIAEDTLRRAVDVFKCQLTQGYGLTETTAGATVMTPVDTLRGLNLQPDLLGSVGQPLLGTSVRIVDEHDQPVPAGVSGEIVIRGPQLMRGYWKRPRASAETLRNGWLRTGDVGRLDADGFLYIQDRIKDVIISGGTNVYPRMVEQVLEKHGAVLEVAVIGVPDTHWGESVKAVVVLRPGVHASEEELIAFCRDKLGGFQRPRSVDFASALPRTTTGKVMRRTLREPYWAIQKTRVGQV